jgi:hypothetical protein
MNFLILTVCYIIIIEFMKKKKKEDGSSFEEGMLKLLRTLPKVLKFLPSDKAKDARNFMMSFQYWLGGITDDLTDFPSLFRIQNHNLKSSTV